MGKTYRTAQGKSLDLEKLKLQNELVPAVGNMRVNARGDQLGSGGQVVKSREEMLDQHYRADVSRRRNGAKEDVIPTRAGKADDIEPVKKYNPSSIEADVTPAVAEPVVDEVLEDDFVDPEPVVKKTVKETVKENAVSEDDFVEPDPNPTPDKVTGVAKGETALKGGLARAVAKTREYEKKKNKPKRI